MRSFWLKNQGLMFPLMITASVLVIVAPLPPALLDLLLSANITLSVLILLTTIYIRKPLEFNVFPSVLLGTTLLRLVLNVATTRLILTRGAVGTGAAGGVIQAFGEFVAGGQIAVGLIIFVILVVIQFLVITKGATRISEVAARFALDAMPGKQMAIDSELATQAITREEAKRRREEVAQQADFYGAMDGASKFVRGDAIAGIVITIINIAGGMYVGMIDHGMTAADAAMVFTKLTIGDGLVTQIPAFLLAMAAGLLVTRSSADSDLPRDMLGQIFVHPEAMGVSSAFVFFLSFTGLPRWPLLMISSALAMMAVTLKRSKAAEVIASAKAQQEEAVKPAEVKPEDRLTVDPMALDLGWGLLKLGDAEQGGDLQDRIPKLREVLAEELGIIMPRVRLRDNIKLPEQTYEICIRDIPVARGEIYVDGLLAIDTGAVQRPMAGIEAKDPSFGLPAVWIEPGERDRAVMFGYHVVDPATVMVTHLTEVVRRYSSELLSREAVHKLLDTLKNSAPKLVEELVPEVLKVTQIHQVLSNLLSERVPIRNLERILEALGDCAERSKDLGILTEYARHALSRTICQQYRDSDRVLQVATLDPALEDVINAGVHHGERGMEIKLSPQVMEAVTRGVADVLKESLPPGRHPVLLVSPQIRSAMKKMTSVSIPDLVVLSLNETTRDTQVESVGQVSIEVLNRRGSLVRAS